MYSTRLVHFLYHAPQLRQSIATIDCAPVMSAHIRGTVSTRTATAKKQTATKMTSAQIAQAQELAQRCQASSYKQCD